MTEREARVLDAAIDVIAVGGARGLTHRAVDAASGLPAGSTSNLFRTREALLSGVLRRLVEQESRTWATLSRDADVSSIEGLAHLLARVVEELSGPRRRPTQARYAIVTQGELPAATIAELRSARAAVTSWLAPLLRGLGSTDDEADAVVVVTLIDGLLLAKVTELHDTVDAQEAVTALLLGLAPTSGEASPANGAGPGVVTR